MIFKIRKLSRHYDYFDEIEINTIEELEELYNKYDGHVLLIDFNYYGQGNRIAIGDDYLDWY